MPKNSLVSPDLLRNNLKRFWPLWLAGFVSLLLFAVVPLYSTVIDCMRTYQALDDRISAVEGIWHVMHLEAWVFAMVAVVIVAVAVNEHLFDSRAATFVGSLPLPRRTVFVTQYLTGLVPLLAAPALAALCMLPLKTIAGTAFALRGIEQWYLLLALLIFCLYSFAHLVCQLAGTRTVAVLLYGVFSFLWVALEAAMELAITALMYGVSSVGYVAQWLSPGAWMLLCATNGFDGQPRWSSLAASAVVAVVVVAVSCLLFERRDLETASNSVSFDVLRPALKYLAGISMALMFSSIYCLLALSDGLPANSSQVATLLAMMVAGGALGILFSEMIMSRSTHVLGRCWRGALVLTVASVAFVGICHFDLLGMKRFVPTPDAVSDVSIECTIVDRTATFSSREAVATVCDLQRDIIAYNGQGEGLSGYLQVAMQYRLRDGRYVMRQYQIPCCFYQYRNGEMAADEGSLLIDRLLELEDTPEGRASRFASVLDGRTRGFSMELEYRSSEHDNEYRTITLSAAECDDLIEHALRQDLLEGEAGMAWSSGDGDSGLDASLRAFVPRSKAEGDPTQVFYLQLNTRTTPKTVEWVCEHYDGITLYAW